MRDIRDYELDVVFVTAKVMNFEQITTQREQYDYEHALSLLPQR